MSNRNFKRAFHNPLELITQWWPGTDISHIHYDPDMKSSERDYWRVGQSGGDGTMAFTMQMLQEVLLPLLNKESYYNQVPEEDIKRAVDIEYTIGNIWHSTVYGMIYLKCSKDHKYHGQKERVRIPVKCTLLY